MFLRFHNKKDLMLYMASVMGIEEFVDGNVANFIFSDNDFVWRDMSLSTIVMISLQQKGFDLDVASKIYHRIERIPKPFIFFDIDINVAYYYQPLYHVRKPRRLWKFRQSIVKKGYKPYIFIFRNHYSEAYVTNKLEGVKKAWKLLTTD